MKDPIVEEVRQTRLEIEKECAKAGISYKDHLLAVQKQYGNRLVTPPVGDFGKGLDSDPLTEEGASYGDQGI